MSLLLKFLEEHVVGILVGLFCLLFVLGVVQWLAWLFNLGRYRERASKDTKPQPSSIGYIVADLLVKIINDFRHLLALVIMLIFSLALGWALFSAGSAQKDIGDALQSVMATLGGLVGSLIGYYFGEAAARKPAPGETPPAAGGAPPPANVPPITPVPSVTDLKAAKTPGHATPTK